MLRRALPIALPGLFALLFAGLFTGLAVGLSARPGFAQSAATQANGPLLQRGQQHAKIVNEVYASPANQRNLGHDRLGSEVVQPGGR